MKVCEAFKGVKGFVLVMLEFPKILKADVDNDVDIEFVGKLKYVLFIIYHMNV